MGVLGGRGPQSQPQEGTREPMVDREVTRDVLGEKRKEEWEEAQDS